MGLDMYLLAEARNKKVGKKNTTGACGGLFPFTINSEGKTEIGYWRKNYRLADKLTAMLFEVGEEDNCVAKELTQQQLEKLISFCEFAEEDVKSGNDDNGWYPVGEFERSTKIFKDALKYAKQGVRIFYKQWY